MASIGTITADVELSGDVKRTYALDKAIVASNGPETPDSIVERAQTFLAFLNGENDT